eukprot:1768720-Prymnesium_polylepis.1
MLPIDNNRAKNPGGRTGATGKGVLKHAGPNYAVDIIVTRTLDKDVEMIAHLRDGGEWAIPGSIAEVDQIIRDAKSRAASMSADPAAEQEHAWDLVERAFKQKMTLQLNGERQGLKALAEQIGSAAPSKLYDAYCDDPRNTDDAWIESC